MNLRYVYVMMTFTWCDIESLLAGADLNICTQMVNQSPIHVSRTNDNFYLTWEMKVCTKIVQICTQTLSYIRLHACIHTRIHWTERNPPQPTRSHPLTPVEVTPLEVTPTGSHPSQSHFPQPFTSDAMHPLVTWSFGCLTHTPSKRRKQWPLGVQGREGFCNDVRRI